MGTVAYRWSAFEVADCRLRPYEVSTVTTSPLRVDVFSDIVCPWCFIGRKRLRDALDTRDDARDAVVVHHSYLLDPSVPKEGLDLRATLARKYGGDPERMFAGVEAAARESGITLDFKKVERMPSTVDAHTILRHADKKGTQVPFVDALFDAYFLNGQDIGDANLLLALAVKHGFSHDEAEALLQDDAERAQTKEDALQASQSGISGVPFFIFNEELAFSGAQPQAIFEKVLGQVLDKASE
jgi:predicted DsbA family dithiol-disulfide isomerase